MKKICSFFTAAVFVALFCGCHIPIAVVPPPAPAAQLSVVYGCMPALPAPGTVLVYDTTRILFTTQNDEDILYASGTVTAGSNMNLSFKTGNYVANSTLYTSNFNLAANGNYCMFFGGPAASPCQLFVTNDMSAPASGMAKVRFVDLSSDTINFNIFKGAVKLDSGFTYQSVSPFFQVPADSMAAFTFADASGSNFPVSTGTFNLGAGSIYIIVLSGSYVTSPFYHPTKIIMLNPKLTL